jgi:hypothetical protein
MAELHITHGTWYCVISPSSLLNQDRLKVKKMEGFCDKDVLLYMANLIT